jgi:hypothetical protein
MTIELLNSKLSKKDALDLLTKLIYSTISHHELKIIESKRHKDIIYRKAKIIEFQKVLFELDRQFERTTDEILFQNIINIKI